MGSERGSVELVNVTKRYGDVIAVDSLNLEIKSGEFLSLLGPSGCGKTTTLRMLAGFEQPDEGFVRISGEYVQGVPPYKRDVNTVFQHYALFPHMNVAENVAYGLRQKGVSKSEIGSKVIEALDMVQMSKMATRKPRQLSGGQQQRVAVARALVNRPSILLLDEPLGALDAKLRKTLQSELVSLQRDLGITFVYVTHDQEEALTMSDRLAVMDHGVVAQLGTPREVYERPENAYVADFLGTANLIDAQANGDGSCTLAGQRIAVAESQTITGPVRLIVRPERLRLVGPGAQSNLAGFVSRVVYVGSVTQVYVELAFGVTVQALMANDGDAVVPERGSLVQLWCPSDAVRILAH